MNDYTFEQDFSSDPQLFGTDPTTSVDPAAFVAIAIGYFIFIVAMYVVMSIFLGKIFKKAGVPAWIAWVPVYNTWKLLQLGGQQGFWAILAFIPFVNIVSLVFMYIAMYNIGLKLGKDGAFVILAILLSPVWIIWLGVDDSKWDDSKGAKRTDSPSSNPPASEPPQTPPAAPTSQPPVAPPPAQPPAGTPPTPMV